MSDRPKTVLIVDDDPDFLLQQKTQIEAAGFETVTAGGREEAEQRLSEIEPDLVLVDLMMEENDAGFVLCHHIKKKHPDCPVIVISAVTSETGIAFDARTDEERSWVKADAFLAKPVRFEQLKREIDRLMAVN